MSRHPADREHNWYPISEAGRFTGACPGGHRGHRLNDQVLAVAAELAQGTMEAMLAKSDLELGIEALLGDL